MMRRMLILIVALLAAMPAQARVRTGIDVLQDQRFAPLREMAARHGGRLRLAILANPISVDGQGRRTIDVLRKDAQAAVPGLEVVRLFAGEHGIDATQDDENVGNAVDKASGLPIIGLYGRADADKRPNACLLYTSRWV